MSENENKTIEQIVSEEVDGDAGDLLAALVAREDEMKERLMTIGQRFGLMPQIVAKAVQVLGLGTPPTDEESAFVDAQYDEVLRQIRAATEQKVQMLRAMGVPVEVPEMTDPMTATPSEVPDAPPETL